MSSPYLTGGPWLPPECRDTSYEDESFEGEHVHELINGRGRSSYYLDSFFDGSNYF